MKGQKLSDEDKAKRAKVPRIVITEDGAVAPANGEKVPKKKIKPSFDQTKEPPEPEWEAINSDLSREEIEDRVAVCVVLLCLGKLLISLFSFASLLSVSRPY
jgi:hypothetical protein